MCLMTSAESLATLLTIFGDLVAKVQRDARSSGINLTVRVQPASHDWPMTFTYLVCFGGMPSSGLEIAYGDDFESTLLKLIQDDMMEEVSGPWPPCPAAGDPLLVSIHADQSIYWECDRGHGVSIPLGELGTTATVGGETDGS